MKIKIQYATTKTDLVPGSESLYTHRTKKAELIPVCIFRRSCGSGKASNRFYYTAKFVAPEDAGFVYDGYIFEGINRKTNPQFNPKKITFNGNIAII